jgi:hypothetical protein
VGVAVFVAVAVKVGVVVGVAVFVDVGTASVEIVTTSCEAKPAVPSFEE